MATTTNEIFYSLPIYDVYSIIGDDGLVNVISGVTDLDPSIVYVIILYNYNYIEIDNNMSVNEFIEDILPDLVLNFYNDLRNLKVSFSLLLPNLLPEEINYAIVNIKDYLISKDKIDVII